MDFHALFDAQYAPVYRYLAHRLGDPAAAEDLAAETFLRAYAARASFRPGSPRAWLFTIATNLLRDHARGAGRRDAALAAWAGREPAAAEPEFESRPAARARARRPARRGARGAAAVRLGRALLRGDRHRHGRRGRHRPLPPRPRPRATRRRARPGEEPEMTVDDRLRAAHARIPEPDEATIARARALVCEAAAERAAPATTRRRRARCARRRRRARAPAGARRAPAAPPARRGRRCVRSRPRSPRPRPRRALRDVARRRSRVPARGPVLLPAQHVPHEHDGTSAPTGARPRARATRRTRSRAASPRRSGWRPTARGGWPTARRARRTCPARPTSGPGARPGSPDLAKLMGPPGRWGPKRTDYGPGGFEAAHLSAANLDAVLPEKDRLSVLPRKQRELREFLIRRGPQAAPERARRSSPRHVRHRRARVPAVSGDAARPARGADRGAAQRARRPRARQDPRLAPAARSRAFQLPADMEGGPVIAYDPATSTAAGRRACVAATRSAGT